MAQNPAAPARRGPRKPMRPRKPTSVLEYSTGDSKSPATTPSTQPPCLLFRSLFLLATDAFAGEHKCSAGSVPARAGDIYECMRCGCRISGLVGLEFATECFRRILYVGVAGRSGAAAAGFLGVVGLEFATECFDASCIFESRGGADHGCEVVLFIACVLHLRCSIICSRVCSSALRASSLQRCSGIFASDHFPPTHPSGIGQHAASACSRPTFSHCQPGWWVAECDYWCNSTAAPSGARGGSGAQRRSGAILATSIIVSSGAVVLAMHGASAQLVLIVSRSLFAVAGLTP